MDWRRCLILAFVAGMLCNGCIPPNSEVRLGVPYRKQTNYNYCAVASVLMWRLYDGLPEVTQASIFNWMGGQGCTTQDRVAAAVNHFTATHDVQWDLERSPNYKEMLARQVTSIDARFPVIAVIDYDHTVVVNGGKWHEEGANQVWDYVLYHDPGTYSNVYAGAGHWRELFCSRQQTYCDQIISSTAIKNWWANYQAYAESVRLYGDSVYEGGPITY